MKKVFRLPHPAATSRPEFGPQKPWLAPLAGYSDLPFRLLCIKYGAATCETEMLSAKGLVYQTPGSAALLASCPEDQPLVIQLFGDGPQSLGQAVKILRTAGYAWFDLNLGCSVRKVMRQGAGVAMLADSTNVIATAKAMLEAVKSISDTPGGVGFKLRLGLTPDMPVLPDLALRLEDAGAAWITLHPRYASQGFAGHADWEWLARLAKRLDIPLIASGDLLDAAAGVECIANTGATGVMYARGALRDPAIFARHLEIISGHKPQKQTHENLRDMINLHVELARRYDTEKGMLLKMRSLVPRYVRFLPGVGELRKALCQCESWEDLSGALDSFLENTADIA